VTGNEYDLTAIVDNDAGTGGIEHGELLNEFVDAMLLGDEQDAARMRKTLRDTLGDAAFVDTCSTVASFNAVVKIADGSGIPLEEAKAETSKQLREDLGINGFRAS
jgi:hypothetical protein